VTRDEHQCPTGWDPAQLLAYLEGDLDEADVGDVEDHLKECPVCRREVETLRAMVSVLTENVEAFHPDDQELYSFVALAEDPGGDVADHLESCARCRESAELIEEMISIGSTAVGDKPRMPVSLKERLGQPAGVPVSKSSGASLSARLMEFFGEPYRPPTLALGTIAALLVVAVLAVPLWRMYHEIPHPGRVSVSDEASGVPESRVRKPAETESGVMERRPQLMDSLAEEKDEEAAKEAPRRERKKFDRPRAPVRAGEADRAVSQSQRDLTKYPAPGVATPRAKMSKRAGIKAKIAEPRSLSFQSAPKKRTYLPSTEAAGKFVGKPGRGAVSPVPVNVRIVDEHGKEIPGIKLTGKRLKDQTRFLFRRDLEEPAAAPPRDSIGRAAVPDRERRIDRGYDVVVTVHPSGDAYDLVTSLYESGGDRELKVISENNVAQDQLAERIESLVLSLLGP